MLMRHLFNALLRMAFAISLTAVTTPIASHEAEAAKAGKRLGAATGAVIAGKAVAAGTRDRSLDRNPAEVANETAVEARSADETGTVEQAPVRAMSATVLPGASATQKDIDVPGCAHGKLCIVCIAGCNNEANEIVHSVPKGLRAE